MKYGIPGIEKGRTIKNIDVINDKVIEVKYLNGKKDVIEYSEENKNKVIGIMTEQAESYVDGDKKLNAWFKSTRLLCIVFVIYALSYLLASNVIPFFIMASIGGICGILSAIINQEKKYYEKYSLFLKDEFKKELGQYKKVMSKEKSLGKKISREENKQSKLESISQLDGYSLEDLKKIREKVSRYTSLVGDNIEVPALEEEKGKQKVKK